MRVVNVRVPAGNPPQATELRANGLTVGSPELGQPGLMIVEEKDEALALEGVTLEPLTVESTGQVHPPTVSQTPPRARKSNKAASLQRRLTVARAMAPIAVEAIDQLLADIAERRPNDTSSVQALEAMRDALNEVIDLLNGNAPPEVIAPKLNALRRFEKHVDATLATTLAISKDLGQAALLAMSISMILREPISGGLVAGILAYVQARRHLKG